MDIRSFRVQKAVAPEVPLVVSIPHCGTYVPDHIRARFASDRVRSLPMTDWYLHHLCDFLAGMGVTVIYGTYSRFVADIDSTGALRPSGRADARPLVRLQMPDGEPIYTEPPSPRELQARRDFVYAPYHARLHELLQSRITRFGAVAFMDLHSFPSQMYGAGLPQVCLGDDGGRANSGWLTKTLQHAFRQAGIDASRHAALQGEFDVRHYGALPHVAAVYAALRWDLYLDERHPNRAPTHVGFRAFKSVLRDVFAAVLVQIDSGALHLPNPAHLDFHPPSRKAATADAPVVADVAPGGPGS